MPGVGLTDNHERSLRASISYASRLIRDGEDVLAAGGRGDPFSRYAGGLTPTTEEPVAESLYGSITRRFVDAANAFLARVGTDAGEGAANHIAFEDGFQARRQFFFASLMYVGTTGPVAWVLDRLLPAAVVRRRVSETAAAYLTQLLWTNSHRVANDMRDRVRESRRLLERTIRRRLEATTASAERALALALAKHQMEQTEVRSRLERLAALSAELASAIGE